MKSTIQLLLAGLAWTVVNSLPQEEVTDEKGDLCDLQLQTKLGSIQRTDDYDIVPKTNSTLWPTAYLYLTQSTGRLYGGNGERCDFDCE